MTSNAWDGLAADYELARRRPDSLDRLLEWPAQQAALGDITGLRILDVGCGSGAKAVALAQQGAAEVLGIDISDTFTTHDRSNVELVQGDLSDLAAAPAIRGRVFDTIVFFQSLGYSTDQVQTLTDARSVLAPGGKILVQRSHPVRYAVERAEANDTSTGRDGTRRSPSPIPEQVRKIIGGKLDYLYREQASTYDTELGGLTWSSSARELVDREWPVGHG
ncbi:MAG TPA: class I SAM-dependent methyltransferase [Microlunatus sp.]|nr:class I SAM-dependent methyltransferase [Microlunatus sp.]